jgi:Glycosyl hydrolases family 16
MYPLGEALEPRPGRRFAVSTVTAFLAASALCAPSAAVAASRSFPAVADARVEQAHPASNYGRSSRLRVDGSTDPDVQSYLRFDVNGLATTVARARLRVFASDDTTTEPSVYGTSNSWSEGGITWNNRPARTGPIAGGQGSVQKNTWVEFDVTAAVQASGTYSFVLVTPVRDGINMASRQASASQPQLVVETADLDAVDPPTSAPSTGSAVFFDDFDGPAGVAPDPSRWRIYGGSAPPRWGLECFVNDRNHVALDGLGHLALTGRQASSTPCTTDGSGAGYTSGGVDTGSEGALFQAQPGDLVEVRAKISCGSGTWDALWMSGVSPGFAWPTDGEIDIFENMPDAANGTTDEFGVKQTVHGPTSSGGHWQIGNERLNGTRLCDDFHTYAVDWEPGRVAFMFDGQITRALTPLNLASGWFWPFDQHPEKIILDLQLGGTWGGQINTQALPASLSVDWVRVTR